VNLSAISGMQAASLMFDQSGAAIAGMSVTPDVDLAAEITNLSMASVAYDVNARVLQAQDETQQSLIDIVA